MKLAIVMPNWIGDAVMATPAIRAIRTTYPEAEFVAIHRPVIGAVLQGTDLVDRQMVHDPRGPAQNRGWALIGKLRKERFDIAVLFPNSWRSAWVALLSGARRRIGFRRDGRQILLTDCLTPHSRTSPNPVIDEYNRLAKAAGAEQTNHRMELAVTDRDQRHWEQFVGTHPRFESDYYVCLNPGGAFGAAKHWPAEFFGLLANRIAAKFGCSVIAVCGPAERDQAKKIVQTADHPQVFGLQDSDVSVGLTKAMVQRSRLLVSTDSGPRHFAAALGVPVISLFGPTHIAWSETHYEHATHLQHQVECGPCQQRVCPLQHHRCMRELSVDRVFQAVERRFAMDHRPQLDQDVA